VLSWFRRRDDRDWRDVDLLALDFETTTGEPREAEPLSVGWVLVRAGRVRLADAGYRLVAHDGHLPPAALPIHGLLPADLRRGASLDEVADALRDVARDRIVVAHGAWIERALLGRLDVGHAGVVDTMAIVRRLDERDGGVARASSLNVTARRFGVTPFRAHHAFGDALTTALLLVVLATRLERARGACPLDDLLRLGRI
jgi:DNA polymerase-3 subunit epsilon